MKHILLGTLAFIVATLLIEGGSHFAINKEFYATIPFARVEPLMGMAIIVMLAQGATMSWFYRRFHDPASPMRSGWVFAMCFAVVLVGYIAFVEPSKYSVPSVAHWAAVEATAGFLQMSLFGILLGLIHGRQS